MKYHGCILEFTDRRNHELIQAFRQAISRHTHIDISQISQETVNTPCSRFWVSEERATIVINAINRNKTILKNMRPTRRDMFQEIYTRVMALRNTHPSKPLHELVIQVVNSQAPRFYMTPRSAMETIYKIKKGYYHKYR